VVNGPNIFQMLLVVNVACDHGSVLFWQHCDALCISGFVDDVALAHSGPVAR